MITPAGALPQCSASTAAANSAKVTPNGEAGGGRRSAILGVDRGAQLGHAHVESLGD
jgi:hypothetical protein